MPTVVLYPICPPATDALSVGFLLRRHTGACARFRVCSSSSLLWLVARHPSQPANILLDLFLGREDVYSCSSCTILLSDPCCHASTSSHTAPVPLLMASNSGMWRRRHRFITFVVVPWQQVLFVSENTKALYSSQTQLFRTLSMCYDKKQGTGDDRKNKHRGRYNSPPP